MRLFFKISYKWDCLLTFFASEIVSLHLLCLRACLAALAALYLVRYTRLLTVLTNQSNQNQPSFSFPDFAGFAILAMFCCKGAGWIWNLQHTSKLHFWHFWPHTIQLYIIHKSYRKCMKLVNLPILHIAQREISIMLDIICIILYETAKQLMNLCITWLCIIAHNLQRLHTIRIIPTICRWVFEKLA